MVVPRIVAYLLDGKFTKTEKTGKVSEKEDHELGRANVGAKVPLRYEVEMFTR